MELIIKYLINRKLLNTKADFHTVPNGTSWFDIAKYNTEYVYFVTNEAEYLITNDTMVHRKSRLWGDIENNGCHFTINGQIPKSTRYTVGYIDIDDFEKITIDEIAKYKKQSKS